MDLLLAATTHHYGWRPFLDPIDVAIPAIQIYWFVLLVPVSLLVSLAYKAVRVPDLERLPRAVVAMTAQIILAMIALGIASYVLVQIVIPMIAPMPNPF